MENVDNAPEQLGDGTNSSLPQPSQNESATENRNRNLDILKAYIQRQRALLERIKQDVGRLEASKPALVADSGGALSRILQSDNHGEEMNSRDAIFADVSKLSELVKEVHGSGEQSITKEVDWSLFRGSDVSSLRALQPRSRLSSIPPGTPALTAPPLTPSTPSLISARSSLSSFISLDCSFENSSKEAESPYQIRVREERVKSVDPALSIASQFLASLPPDSDDECVKQAKAREAKDVKAREARNIKSHHVKTNGHVRKSAHRRKSEASAAAAASRPRGQGGRFKKKEAVVNEALAQPGIQIGGTSVSAPSNSASIPTALVSEISPSTPFVISSEADSQWIDSGRPQRIRKPSIRFASAAPSVASSRSSTSTGRNGNSSTGWQPSSSPAASSNPPRGRLTIRIPARRPSAKGAGRNTADERDRQVSASTSTTSSSTTSTTGNTSLTPSVGLRNGNGYLSGKQCTSVNWSTAINAGNRQGSNPVTEAVSALQSQFFGVKQEEEEHKDDMDVDAWNAIDERSGRFRYDSAHSYKVPYRVGHDSSPEDYVTNLDEGEEDNDSEDSFVPEVLPPLPGSSASSSSTNQTGSNGRANGDSSGRGELNRTSSRRGNPLSQTFNVAWSDEEQRMLDILLVRYPDGTKNRWANISRAMGGTRTPRQVASRVQKYFAKMKKWGIDVS